MDPSDSAHLVWGYLQGNKMGPLLAKPPPTSLFAPGQRCPWPEEVTPEMILEYQAAVRYREQAEHLESEGSAGESNLWKKRKLAAFVPTTEEEMAVTPDSTEQAMDLDPQ